MDVQIINFCYKLTENLTEINTAIQTAKCHLSKVLPISYELTNGVGSALPDGLHLEKIYHMESQLFPRFNHFLEVCFRQVAAGRCFVYVERGGGGVHSPIFDKCSRNI